jgi:MFS family permease
VFAAVTFSIGVVVTFLPLADPSGRTALVAVALFLQALLALVSRWVTGRYGDRRGYGRLLAPAVVVTGLGVGTLVWYDHPVAVLAGMVAFGIGYGAAQTVTLSLMFSRARPHEHGKVSAIWNLAYDAGMGLGAVGFGLVVGGTGYAWAFGLTALVLAAVLPLTRS